MNIGRTSTCRVNASTVVTFTALALLMGAPPDVSAQSVTSAGPSPRPEVTYAVRSDSSAAMRDLPTLPPLPKVLGEVFERPRKLLPNRQGSAAPESFSDPAVQTEVAAPASPLPGSAFEGVGNVNAVLPPDPTGAVGRNHYVQMVNLSYAIYDKATGVRLYGPAASNTLWQGFGGACETTNDGDPVVLYDQKADRWLMSQFALPNYPRGPFYQCIAISKTDDPLEGWWRYAFVVSNDKLNDYPKFGMWPDGYYMSINQFKCKFVNCSWGGAGAAAFERDKMLNGQAARMVFFDLYATDPNLGGMLPSDWDGATAPPAGAPNYFAQMDDNAWGYSPDQLQIWKFHVDWNDPTLSTFEPDPALPVMAFDSNMCGYARNCIPQKGTTAKVDALSDRLMFRLQYRNFDAYQTLVLNHTVDVNNTDRAGVRWYELRKVSGPWSIANQATFSPNSDHRWIGSIAMNDNGSIALGYSLSSSTQYPKIMATGLKSGSGVSATVGQEVEIKAGTGSQTHTSGRWGDYSQLTVDPVDGCTFWYTNEYYDAGGLSYGWKTYVGSFTLGDCGGSGGGTNQPPTVSFTETCTFLACAFDSTANDPEGGSLTYSWTFGDGGSSETADPAHTYASAGTYTVSVTVNDGTNPDVTATHQVTVNSEVTGNAQMTVAGLDGSASTQGRNKWKATATVTIVDDQGQPVSGAVASGTFTPGGGVSCTTGSTGSCSYTLVTIPSSTASVTFKLESVSHPSYPALTPNQTITISRP